MTGEGGGAAPVGAFSQTNASNHYNILTLGTGIFNAGVSTNTATSNNNNAIHYVINGSLNFLGDSGGPPGHNGSGGETGGVGGYVFLNNSTMTLSGGSGSEVFLAELNSAAEGEIQIAAHNTLIIGSSNESATIQGVISGGGSFTFAGNSNTQTLTNANTYTGGTTITGGTLALSGSGSLITTSTVTVTAGTFDISAATSPITIGELDGEAAGNVNLGGNTLITSLGSFAGTIKGSGELQKIGAGTLKLSGTNTYSGGTELANGVIEITNSSALGTGVLTLSGATGIER